MAYSDQKYYDRQPNIIADSKYFNSTYTASVATAIGTGVAPVLGTFGRNTVIKSMALTVVTPPKIGPTTITFLQGTNTFAVATISSTATYGTIVAVTFSNTASLSTNTQTFTLANGSTVISTNTSTTNWAYFGSGTAPTVTVIGSATASADTWGAYEVITVAQEQP